MTQEEMIEQLANTILLIKLNGKDWLDERDIPILEEAIKSMQKELLGDCISFPEGTLKKRGKDYVVYNVEWLKKHWQTELKVMGIECEDTISRQAVLDKAKYWIAMQETKTGHIEKRGYFVDVDDIKALQSVQPAQIIRCKDCKYVWKEDGYDNLWCHRLRGSFSVDRDGYCAWAKIEEGE